MNSPYTTGTYSSRAAFTLIELSIVLVIIGLLVGGVLSGKDLVRAAEARAQLSQIEKYNTAVNTFHSKYGALPGDMDPATASQYGFQGRPGWTAGGDGNRVIEGCYDGGASGFLESCETIDFWVDLTVGNPASPMNINLIDGSFTTPFAGLTTSANISDYFPAAKLGKGNYVFVFSTLAVNYFGVSQVTSFGLGSYTTAYGEMTTAGSITAQQAYQMDAKADDGLPVSGNIIASLINISAIMNATYGEDTPITTSGILSPHTSSPAAVTDCFDSTGSSYALQNGSSKGVCGISFRFQ